ncbi:hypothetical protein FISHEDRAFT_47645, partial [Fistulina hepatica ATCC 64428]
MLPLDVPKVDNQGSNWPIFALHFEDVMHSKGLWTHFDGSELLPIETDDNKDAITKWKTDEVKARSLLTQHLPDVTVSKITKINTMAKRWKAITTDFSLKNELLQAGL